jgi:hypothetical protein
MTFRFYRPDFAPLSSTSSPSYTGTPHCACSVPCTLRPDGRGRARSKLSLPSTSEEEAKERWGDVREMVYFWVCNHGAQNEGKTCGHFRVMDMKKEGRGRWFVPSRAAEEGGEEGATEETKEDE